MVMVNVAVPPLTMLAVLPALSQLLSEEGVMVTLPAQLPVTPMVTVALCVVVLPALAVKVSEVGAGVCSVQGGCTFSVTEVCTLPTVWPVTLSTAVIVTWPV